MEAYGPSLYKSYEAILQRISLPLDLFSNVKQGSLPSSYYRPQQQGSVTSCSPQEKKRRDWESKGWAPACG